MEVERKHKLPEGSFAGIKSRLAGLGFAPAGTKHQIDVYYLKSGQPDTDTHFMIGTESAYLRLRHNVETDAFSFDLKLVDERAHSGIHGEYEVALKGAPSFENCDAILKLLGFRRGCVVDKRRETFRKGEFEIALDAVEGLGEFIEIEIIADESSASAALARVDALASEFGLGEHTRMITGYVDLWAWKKAGRPF